MCLLSTRVFHSICWCPKLDSSYYQLYKTQLVPQAAASLADQFLCLEFCLDSLFRISLCLVTQLYLTLQPHGL